MYENALNCNIAIIFLRFEISRFHTIINYICKTNQRKVNIFGNFDFMVYLPDAYFNDYTEMKGYFTQTSKHVS